MVEWWCGQCQQGHTSASECPHRQALRGPKGKTLKGVSDHARRAQRADGRAPKGYSNSLDNGCVVVGVGLVGAALALAGLAIWGAAEALASVLT